MTSLWRRGGGLMRYLPSGSLFASPILRSVSSARLIQRGLTWPRSPSSPDQLA